MSRVGVRVNEHRNTWNNTTGPFKETFFLAAPYTSLTAANVISHASAKVQVSPKPKVVSTKNF